MEGVRWREQLGFSPPCSPCRATPHFSPFSWFSSSLSLSLMLPRFLSGERRRNHGATHENPNALQGPSAARLDLDAAVVPRVQPICHRPVQISLDQIERESRLPSYTLVDPPRSIDRGGPAGDARRRPAAHGEAGLAMAGGGGGLEVGSGGRHG